MEYGSVTETNKGTSTNITMNIASMEVFKCILIHEVGLGASLISFFKSESAISIIQPFDMMFRYTTTPNLVDISSKLEPLRMILSYQV